MYNLKTWLDKQRFHNTFHIKNNSIGVSSTQVNYK